MLPPIPRPLLKSIILLEAAASVDRDRRVQTVSHVVKRVHIQPGSAVRKTAPNTELSLRSTLFVDGRLSSPSLDWSALLKTAQSVGGDVKVSHGGEVYTVGCVERISDDEDRLHHWEIGLI